MTAVGDADGAGAHVVVDALDPLELGDEVVRHLGRARRLRPGDRFSATDGAGRWRWCRWRGDGAEPDGAVDEVARPEPPLTVAVALTKGDKPDLVVQKLTELGIDRIVVFRSARSVVHWDDDKAAAHRNRWLAVARAAVGQSHGCWVPAIEAVTDVDGVVAMGARRLDRDGRRLRPDDTVVAVGPEGGWSDGERAALSDAVSLGTPVLRAETAAITAGGVLTSLRAEMVRYSSDSGHCA